MIKHVIILVYRIEIAVLLDRHRVAALCLYTIHLLISITLINGEAVFKIQPCIYFFNIVSRVSVFQSISPSRLKGPVFCTSDVETLIVVISLLLDTTSQHSFHTLNPFVS